ncbi:MAG: SGNH/GDSL hydrolase family protein [Clostridiales bacterium]|nr:SGNH/GDSL hydrolase family protein [Clostridiales bacterium]
MLFEKNDTILFIGDSISDYERAKPVGEGLFNAWGRSYVACAGALLNCMYPELGLRVVNMGISGNQVRDLKARWQSDVFDRKPDWVSVLIGINDVWRQFDCPQMPETHVSLEEFEQTYEELIRETLPRVKGMILMTPYYMEPNRGDAMRARMDEYGAVVRKLAEKYALTFVDLQAGWDRLFMHMHSTNIAWDRVHPNQTGCMYIAKQFLSAVGADRC